MSSPAITGEAAASAPSLIANSRWNLSAFALTLAAHFVTLPFIISWIGLTGFGQAGLVLAVCAPFMLIGAVLSQAVTSNVAECLAAKDPEAAGRVLQSALFICAVSCVGGAIVLVTAGPWVLFKFTDIQRSLHSLRVDFIIAAIGWSAQQGMQVLQAATMARQDFRTIAYITAMTAIGTVAFTLGLTAWMPSVEGYLAGMSATFLGGLIAWIVACRARRYGRGIRPQLHRAEFSGLLRFGKWQTIAQLAGGFAHQIDRYVLGAVATPTIVGQYNAANRIQEAAYIGVLKASEVLFPHFGATANTGVSDRARFFLAASWVTITFSAVVLTPVVPLADSILRLWAGPEAAAGGAEMLRLLVIGGAIGCGSNVFSYYLMGIGENAPLAGISVLYSIVTAVASIFFILKFGPYAAGAGVIVAGAVRVGASMFVLRRQFFVFVNRSELWASTILPLVTGLAVAIAMFAFEPVHSMSWPGLGAYYIFLAFVVLFTIVVATCLFSAGREILGRVSWGLRRSYPVQKSGAAFFPAASFIERKSFGSPAVIARNPVSPVCIVDYGVGNIGALLNMLDYLRVDAVASANPGAVAGAERLILPGVGAFDKAMLKLKESGLIDALNSAVIERKVPVLGVCLGMQLFARRSAEGKEEGLGWLDAEVRRIAPVGNPSLKVPHIGWAEITPVRQSPLFPRPNGKERYYFVHSYYMACNHPEDVAAVINYGEELCCAVNSNNIYGVQFHPEKSHRFGMRVLKSFANAKTINSHTVAG